MLHVDLDRHDLTATVQARRAGAERDELAGIDNDARLLQLANEIAAVDVMLCQPFVEPGARDIHASALTHAPRVETLVRVWRGEHLTHVLGLELHIDDQCRCPYLV